MYCKIKILPGEQEILVQKGVSLHNALANAGCLILSPCGGKGICKKCKVKLVSGSVDDTVADKDGYIFSCKAKLKEDITLEIPNNIGQGLDVVLKPKTIEENNGYGVAIDIGTTTIAACIVDLHNGNVLNRVSCLNPQHIYGADVLSRIQSSNDGNLSNLQNLVLIKLRELIRILSCDNDIEAIYISANTTMLHLLLGVNPQSIGVYPFTPVFTDEKVIDGTILGLPAPKIYILPSVSAYIGADIVSGVVACDMLDHNKSEMLCDIGTNGEMVLLHQGKMCAVSTAAGPAFEGANIECGMLAIAGAISKVRFVNQELIYETIDNTSPIGICGSGLIDLLAILLREGIIDESGSFDETNHSVLIEMLKEDRFYITDDIYLSQKDIRQIQLAKSAIRAGIDTLLEEMALTYNDLSTFYISGGLAYYMNLYNAATIGLIPYEIIDMVKLVGNSSLSGALMCLLDKTCFDRAILLAKKITVRELSFSSRFQDLFVENMMF